MDNELIEQYIRDIKDTVTIQDNKTNTDAWYPIVGGSFGSGMKIFSNQPIDARSFVFTYDDLLTWRPQQQGLPYIGMSVLVLFKRRYATKETTYIPNNILNQRYTCISTKAFTDPERTHEIDLINQNLPTDPSPAKIQDSVDFVYYFKPENWIQEISNTNVEDKQSIIIANSDEFTKIATIAGKDITAKVQVNWDIWE